MHSYDTWSLPINGYNCRRTSAATVLKAYKLYKEFGTAIFVENATLLIIGNIVAFVVALLAIRFFIAFLTKYGFRAFGWYRIIVGALILVLLFMGLPLAVA